MRHGGQADAPLPQCVESDLSPGAPIGESELTAIERILSQDLAAFLAALP
jgi:hypothetical protein